VPEIERYLVTAVCKVIVFLPLSRAIVFCTERSNSVQAISPVVRRSGLFAASNAV
jgi:hypothetical protein